jgi:site-specific recombinase XerD
MPGNYRHNTLHPCDSTLLKEYLDFLRTHRGLAKATIVIRANFVAPFLEALNLRKTPEGVEGIVASHVHDYVIKTAGPMTHPSRKHLVSSLRSFLRFCHVRGYTDRDLTDAVPVIRTHKLDRVPKAISWESVQKLLAAPDRNTHEGRREYAVLQLLATYGVRIGQVTLLKLQDIDWPEGLIRFSSSKKGRDLCLPLTHDVAEALLDYIGRTRGKAPFPEVFLTVRGVPRPLGENNHLHGPIARHYDRAGIYSVTKGSHAIRHAFATRLMEKEVPIKTIADLLGHKCIMSTAMYTKVDLEHLRGVACEWPEVEQ